MSEQVVEASSDHQIILGDCLAGMRGLADGSVGVSLLDPPYSEYVHSKFHRHERNDGAEPRAPIEFASLDNATAVAVELVRLTRRWIVVFCDELSLAVWRKELQAAGGEYVRFGIWVKSDGAPQMTGDRPGIPCEHLAIAHGARASGKMHWNSGGKPARWFGPCQERAVARVHATQKPEWLMDALVRDFTDPGELVLDPFAGSGTTGVACKRLGRRFLGFERDPKFHAAAVKRLDGTRQQFEFAPRPAKPKQMGLIK